MLTNSPLSIQLIEWFFKKWLPIILRTKPNPWTVVCKDPADLASGSLPGLTPMTLPLFSTLWPRWPSRSSNTPVSSHCRAFAPAVPSPGNSIPPDTPKSHPLPLSYPCSVPPLQRCLPWQFHLKQPNLARSRIYCLTFFHFLLTVIIIMWYYITQLFVDLHIVCYPY